MCVRILLHISCALCCAKLIVEVVTVVPFQNCVVPSKWHSRPLSRQGWGIQEDPTGHIQPPRSHHSCGAPRCCDRRDKFGHNHVAMGQYQSQRLAWILIVLLGWERWLDSSMKVVLDLNVKLLLNNADVLTSRTVQQRSHCQLRWCCAPGMVLTGWTEFHHPGSSTCSLPTFHLWNQKSML